MSRSDAGSSNRRGLLGLFIADGVSTLGTRMSALAVPWFVLMSTGSASAAGITAFAELGPLVTAQALGGPAVDRLGAWRTCVVGNVTAALGVGAVPVLYAIGALPFGVLCAVLVVVGVARGFADTAGSVLVPGVVEQAGWPMARATGLHDGVRRLAQLVGAPLAGGLIALVSAPAVLLGDAASFAVAVVIVIACVPRAAQPDRPVTQPRSRSAIRTYSAELIEGFRFLRGDRLLLGIAVMIAVTNLLDQSWSAVLSPVWARDVARSPIALGLLAAALGMGAVSGNVVLSWLGPRLPRRLTYGVGFLLCGAPRLVALAVATTVSPVLVVVLLGGLGAGVVNPIVGAVEFDRVPRGLQARVLGTTNAVAWIGMPFGGLLAGLGVDHWGLRPTLWAAAVVYFATTLVPFLFPVWRQLDRPATPATPSPAMASGPSSPTGVGGTASG